MKVLNLIILILSISYAFGKYSFGGCSNHNYITKNIDIARYFKGLWYEIIRDASAPFEKGDCSTAEYEVLANGKVSVKNSEVVKGKLNVALGEAVTTENPNRFQVSFGESFISHFFKGDYQIMETDYEGYSVVYSCTGVFNIAKIEFVWILSRNKEVENLTKLTAYLESEFNYTQKELKVNKHDDDTCRVSS